MRMSHLKVGSAADIPLDIGEFDLSQLTASLTTPSGREEPCLLKMLRNGHVGECVKWTDEISLKCVSCFLHSAGSGQFGRRYEATAAWTTVCGKSERLAMHLNDFVTTWTPRCNDWLQKRRNPTRRFAATMHAFGITLVYIDSVSFLGLFRCSDVPHFRTNVRYLLCWHSKL